MIVLGWCLVAVAVALFVGSAVILVRANPGERMPYLGKAPRPSLLSMLVLIAAVAAWGFGVAFVGESGRWWAFALTLAGMLVGSFAVFSLHNRRLGAGK